MDPVSVSEFRKSTKVILDSARYDPVYLRRGDEVFEISFKGSILGFSEASTFKGDPRITLPPQKLGTLEFQSTPKGPNPFYSEKIGLAAPTEEVVEKPRLNTGPAIMAEMDRVRAEAKEKLEYCQDPVQVQEINIETKATIDNLWTLYRKVTG